MRRQQASVDLQIQLQKKRQGVSRSQVSPPKAIGRSASVVTQTQYFNRPACMPIPVEVLNPQIQKAAADQGLAPELLTAVAHAESGFDPCAVSSKGAAGLMQIMPATGRDLGLVNPWDTRQSLAAGAKYLRQLLDRYNGDLRLALGAYNAGPSRVDQLGDVPPIVETQDYVRRILSEFRTSAAVSDVAELPAP